MKMSLFLKQRLPRLLWQWSSLQSCGSWLMEVWLSCGEQSTGCKLLLISRLSISTFQQLQAHSHLLSPISSPLTSPTLTWILLHLALLACQMMMKSLLTLTKRLSMAIPRLHRQLGTNSKTDFTKITHSIQSSSAILFLKVIDCSYKDS